MARRRALLVVGLHAMSAAPTERGPMRKTAAQRRTERRAESGVAPRIGAAPTFAFHPPPPGFRARSRTTLRRDAGTLSVRSGRHD